MIEILQKYYENVDLEKIINFIYFVIPIVLSIWGVLYIRRSSFYYIEKNNIKLYDDIIKKIDDISIKYKGNDLNENLILFNGTIIFKSHSDVKSDEIDKELTIYSRDQNAQWKHFEITKKSKDFTPKFIIDRNKIIIERSLLKADDFISFVGLLDSKNTNLQIGHRIFNIIPSSQNFKENELPLYKSAAIIFTFLLFFLFSFTMYTQSNNNQMALSNKGNPISKEDSILFKSFDFNILYYNQDRSMKIDSLSAKFLIKENKEKKLVEEYSDKKLDSLTKIYNNNSTYKNHNAVLNQLLENLFYSFKKNENPYSILKNQAEKKLKKLIEENNVKPNSYKINDSISVKFINKKEVSNALENDVSISKIIISFLGYSLYLITFVLSIIFWFKYLRLLKLKKLYNINN